MSYQVGDVVWAKIRGYSPWPGLVSEPWPELRTSKKGPNKTFIYFFGSKNYGWSSASNLRPYHEFKDKLKEFSKKSNFKLAVEEVEKYIENAEKFKSSSQNTDSDNEICNGTTNGVTIQNGIKDESRESSVIQEKSTQPDEKKFKSSSQNTDSDNEICNGTTNGVTIQNGIKDESRESSVIQEKSTQPDEKALDVSVTLPRVDIYDCKRCSRAYLSLVELEDHAIDSHMDTARVALDRLGDRWCRKCGSHFANSYEYNMHMLSHIQQNVRSSHGKRKTNCDNRERKTLEAKYQCEKCDAKYVLESTLMAHSAVHEPMPHVCECGVAYYDKRDLAAHKLLVHPPTIQTETRKKCPKIKKEITSRSSSDYDYDDDGDESYIETKRLKKRTSKAGGRSLKPIDKMTDAEKEILGNLVRKDNKFLCPICNKGISSKHNVLMHYRLHMGDKRHSCQVCGKSFVQDTTLQIHAKRHTGVRDYVCKFCDRGFIDKATLSRHERTHTGEKPYKCKYEYCGKRFSDPSALLRHLRIHTNEKRYTCDRCSKAFTDSSALFYHKKRHDNDKKHFCPTCGKGFYIKYYLEQHIRRVHLPREKTYECKFCLKMFYESGSLDIHVSNIHMKDKEFHCDYCGKVYHFKPTLVGHIREHHTIVFYCDLCQAKFYSESHLKRHKTDGCTRRVFVCEICDKEYASKTTYVTHINAHARLTHTVECHHCGKRSNAKKSLQQHIFTRHLGYPHRCSECWKKFITASDYKKHTCIKKHYPCKVCGMTFYRYDQYVIHREKHKGFFKTYRCHCCDKQFNSKCELRYHMLRQMRREMPRCTPCHKPT